MQDSPQKVIPRENFHVWVLEVVRGLGHHGALAAQDLDKCAQRVEELTGIKVDQS